MVWSFYGCEGVKVVGFGGLGRLGLMVLALGTSK